MVIATVSAPARSSRIFGVMIAASVLAPILTGLCLLPAIMSPMLFDSGESTVLWIMLSIMAALPVAPLVGLALGWVGYARRSNLMVFCGLALFIPPLALVALCLALSVGMTPDTVHA